MLGSAASVAGPNVALNTAVAEVLRQFADELEQAEDFNAALHELIKRTIREHKRIIFNGNGYDDAWIKEATEVRGLLNLKTTPDCLPYFLHEKNIRLFTSHGVLSESEMRARYEIWNENYCKVIHIEGTTMLEMIDKDILPAVTAFTRQLSDTAASKKAVLPSADCTYEETLIGRISELSASLFRGARKLEAALEQARTIADAHGAALAYRDKVLPAMDEARKYADELETMVSSSCWPFPTYGDLLFSIR